MAPVRADHRPVQAEPAASQQIPLLASTCNYQNRIMADSPIAYWRLGETSGITATNIGSLANAGGTYLGGVALAQTGLISGDSNTAAGFDGVNDIVSIPDVVGINLGGPFNSRTIELWFKATSVSGRKVLYEEGGIFRGLNIYLENGKLYVNGYNLEATDGGGATSPWGPKFISVNVAVNTVYYVALVFDGDSTGPVSTLSGTITGYLNGVSFGTVSGAGQLFEHANDIGIGSVNQEGLYHNSSKGSTPYRFSGIIDEVALYDAPLSAAQILAHYSACSSADLAISKQASPEPMVPGEPVSYTIVVSNAGPTGVSGAVISDVLPSGILSPTWQCSATTGGASCTSSGAGNLHDTVTMPADSSITYRVSGNLSPSVTTPVVNVAKILTPTGIIDWDSSNNVATTTTTLDRRADLLIFKSSVRNNPAGLITYTVIAQNLGPSDAHGTVISDSIPAGITSFTWQCTASGGASCSPTGSGHITDTLAAFPVGGEVRYTIVGTLLNSGVTVINTATITPPVGVTNTAPDNSASNISIAGGNTFLPIIMRNSSAP